MWVLLAIAALLPLLFTARARAGLGRQVALMALLVAGLLFLAQAVEVQNTRDWPVLEWLDAFLGEFGRDFRGQPWYEPVMSLRDGITRIGRDGAAGICIGAGLLCLWCAWKRR